MLGKCCWVVPNGVWVVILRLVGLGTAYLLLIHFMEIPILIANYGSSVQKEITGTTEISIPGGSNKFLSSSNKNKVTHRQLYLGNSSKMENKTQLLNGRIMKKSKLISDVNYCPVNDEGRNMCNINLTNAGLLHICTPMKICNVNQNIALNSIRTKTDPSFKICTYPLERDIFISHSGDQKAYEKEPILRYFSLLARAMERAVIDIEPINESFIHLEENVARSNFLDKILLLRHAITDSIFPRENAAWKRSVLKQKITFIFLKYKPYCEECRDLAFYFVCGLFEIMVSKK
ncbi:hypothetical protein ACJMK2_043264 [Sinanodonta woodiana]|uniref:Uncharacterized protein n=1 Tax=Sinanodonta woodiana TaxID=1069815 RepID=A0ABD3VWE1_SINWO